MLSILQDDDDDSETMISTSNVNLQGADKYN